MYAIELSAGLYCVTISDDVSGCDINECFEVDQVIDAGEMVYLEAETEASLQKSCFGQSTGAVTVSVDGGNRFFDVQNALPTITDSCVAIGFVSPSPSRKGRTISAIATG